MQTKDINEDIKWAQINKAVLRSIENPRLAYWVAVAVCVAMIACAVTAVAYVYTTGQGVLDLYWPDMWGTWIATFNFWIGMRHSGTLLSELLLIIQADWRKPIYRFAEAMTTFSLMTSVLFPIILLGRMLILYWVLPYVSDRG